MAHRTAVWWHVLWGTALVSIMTHSNFERGTSVWSRSAFLLHPYFKENVTGQASLTWKGHRSSFANLESSQRPRVWRPLTTYRSLCQSTWFHAQSYKILLQTITGVSVECIYDTQGTLYLTLRTKPRSSQYVFQNLNHNVLNCECTQRTCWNGH